MALLMPLGNRKSEVTTFFPPVKQAIYHRLNEVMTHSARRLREHFPLRDEFDKMRDEDECKDPRRRRGEPVACEED